MTDLSLLFREELRKRLCFHSSSNVSREISADGTRKYLIEGDDGGRVEAVMIKQPEWMTLCLSSQVGCGMGCTFCRTGEMGFQRNLTTSEIIRQVMLVSEDSRTFEDSFSNIVFMGMGEPLHNYRQVVRALKILVDPDGLAISPKKITVSSVGLVPAIEKFGAEGLGINLAVSLNATTDEVRDRIMPINKAYPIETLFKTLRNFPLKSRGRITIEYVLLSGVNDTSEDLSRLSRILRGLPVKINLIPYNENAGLGFLSPPKERVSEWCEELKAEGFDTTIRWSKGRDINAACGQLAVTRTFQPVIIRKAGKSKSGEAIQV